MPGSLAHDLIREAGHPGLRRRRAAAIAGTAAVHLALLLLLLASPPASQPRPVDTALAVFDVAVPPPPLLVEPPPPPARPVRLLIPPRGAVHDQPSGSPRPGPPLLQPRTAAQAATISADLTIAPDAPPRAAGTADVAGLAGVAPGGGEGGRGTGGTGTGPGAGSGRGGTPPFHRAIWICKPTTREMEPFWPAAARAGRLSGAARLSCMITPGGSARRCEVVEKVPLGLGFGQAAVAMSRLFRIRPVMQGRRRLNEPVTVPVYFDALPLPITPKLPSQ